MSKEKKSLLKEIQPYVIKYANVISEVLNVEIEIVDENLFRVAGTGIYSSMINQVCEGLSYKTVMKNGMNKIIVEPSKDECCEKCKLKNTCNEELEIATPIFYKGRIIGVMGIICFDKLQKQSVLINIEENLRFLDNIAELISSKVYEEAKMKMEDGDFFKVINLIKSVDTPIIILDEYDNIFDFNNSAIKEMNLNTLDNREYVSRHNDDDESIATSKFDINVYKDLGVRISLEMGNCHSAFIFKNKDRKVNNKNDIGVEISGVEKIVGKSEPIIEVKKNIKKISKSISTVLITGESGTGKELVARAIHEEGDRKDKPFIAINCAAIPENLLESELFGYSKGAFSGANIQGRMGKFELANTGIIFLDEIGDMPLNLQAKILRVVQDRKCVRVGSNKLVDLDIRIIAATNRNLRKLVEENKFRADLYYRLNVISIKIPPLRDRENDLKIIMDNLINKYDKKLGKYTRDIEKPAMNALLKHSWPGNVRELENCVEHMINLSEDNGVIKLSFLPEVIRDFTSVNSITRIYEEEIKLKDLESKYIEFMVEKYGDSLKAKKIISDKLGIGIATLYRKIVNKQKK